MNEATGTTRQHAGLRSSSASPQRDLICIRNGTSAPPSCWTGPRLSRPSSASNVRTPAQSVEDSLTRPRQHQMFSLFQAVLWGLAHKRKQKGRVLSSALSGGICGSLDKLLANTSRPFFFLLFRLKKENTKQPVSSPAWGKSVKALRKLIFFFFFPHFVISSRRVWLAGEATEFWPLFFFFFPLFRQSLQTSVYPSERKKKVKRKTRIRNAQ